MAAVDEVVAEPALDAVVIVAGIDGIVARAELDGVIAGAAMDGMVALLGRGGRADIDDVIAALSVDEEVCRGGRQEEDVSVVVEVLVAGAVGVIEIATDPVAEADDLDGLHRINRGHDRLLWVGPAG